MGIFDIFKKSKDSIDELVFKSNEAAFDYALRTMPEGFGTMGLFSLAIVMDKPYNSRIEKKVLSDQTITYELKDVKLRVGYKGNDFEVMGIARNSLPKESKRTYNVGDLVNVGEMSQKIIDKIQNKEVDKSKKLSFEVFCKVKPILDVKKREFLRVRKSWW